MTDKSLTNIADSGNNRVGETALHVTLSPLVIGWHNAPTFIGGPGGVPGWCGLFRLRYHQLLLALAFLTRLPLDWFMSKRVIPLDSSIWAFPLAGALVGIVASLPLFLPFPTILNAVLSVGLSVWVTGGQYESALVGYVDAAAGRNRVGRLKIIGDARIGRLSGVALILAWVIRIVAISLLGPCALIAAATGGRVTMVAVMKALPPVNNDNSAFAAGRPSGLNVGIASVFSAVILILAIDGWFLPLIAAIAITAYFISSARRWLNGYTADVLGAAAIVTEIVMLAVMALTS